MKMGARTIDDVLDQGYGLWYAGPYIIAVRCGRCEWIYEPARDKRIETDLDLIRLGWVRCEASEQALRALAGAADSMICPGCARAAPKLDE